MGRIHVNIFGTLQLSYDKIHTDKCGIIHTHTFQVQKHDEPYAKHEMVLITTYVNNIVITV